MGPKTSRVAVYIHLTLSQLTATDGKGGDASGRSSQSIGFREPPAATSLQRRARWQSVSVPNHKWQRRRRASAVDAGLEH
uniref:Secreted protein n=1 Tax=Panagrellus redivivus TaxID=6233 RepID=A0A7E4VQD9_PANRE